MAITRIQFRRDTAANWTSANPVLGNGELGLETDTRKTKIGNGITTWNSLIYWDTIVANGVIAGLSDSAVSGLYSDLSGTPTVLSDFTNDVGYITSAAIPTDISDLTDNQGIIASFVFDGSYESLSNLPTLFSGSYDDLTDKPDFLFGGSYNSLTDLPTLFSGNYNDLTNPPNLSGYLVANDLVSYALNSTLSTYVQQIALTNTLLGYVTSNALTSTLSSYETTASLATTLSDYVQTTDIADHVTTTSILAYNYATEGYVNSSLATLVNSAPGALDTLNELAAALNDDPNFATTITNSIANKVSLVDLNSVALSGSYDDLTGRPYIYTSSDFDTDLSNKSTSDLSEGSNLYFTDARVHTVLGNVSASIVPTTDITYDLGSTTKRFRDLYLSGNSIFLGDGPIDGLVLSNVGGVFTVADESGNPASLSLSGNSTTDLSEGTHLYYTVDRDNDAFDIRIATKSTDDLTEGSNLYYTETRGEAMFDAKLAASSTDNLTEGSKLYYTETRVNTNFALKTTSNLSEGSNLYYTETRGEAMFDAKLAASSTTDLTEGSNLYYTETRVNTNFALKTTSNLSEGSNLYYTSARANNDFDLSLLGKTTDNLTEGSKLYYTETRVNTNFALKTTDNLTEGSNLYYTEARGEAMFDAKLAASYTDNLTEGSNLYFTTGRVNNQIDAYVSGGTGVSVTSGEISIGQDVSTTSNVNFNNIAAAGNVIIEGNLTVSGTTITLDAQNLSITDSMIYLNNGSTVANPDLGIAGNYNDGTYAHTGVFRDATDGTWKFYQGYLPEPDASSFIDTTHASFTYAPVRASLFTGNLTGDVVGDVTGDVTGQVSSISNHTTSNLIEGSKLYYTDSRVGIYLANNSYTTQSNVTDSIAAAATNYATSGQGTRADTALQSADVADVATSGLYNDLAGKPVLAVVATSGLYSSLIGIPNFANVATTAAYSDLSGTPALAAVAITGLYNSLSGRPSLASVATSGSYTDLINPPLLQPVATTGLYNDLSNKPNLATVATTGAFADLASKPNISTVGQTGSYSDIIGTPTLAVVATTGSYNSLLNKPTLGSAAATDATAYATAAQGALASSATQPSDLATVATSGSYTSLSNRPTLGTASAENVEAFATSSQGAKADSAIQSIVGYATESYVDSSVSSLVGTAPSTLNTLNELATALGDDPNFATTISSALGAKVNSADLSDVATSGLYNDLSGKPTLGTAAATNASAYATAAQGALADSATQPGDLSAVATTGSYNSLTDRPVLGTAAATAASAYATSSQGILASSAVQPADLATVATTGLYSDLAGKPTLGTAAATNASAYATAAQGIAADSATQPADLALVATTGSYSNLEDKPTFGTAATTDATAYATAAQGVLAESALQSVAFADLTTTPSTLAGYGITDAADNSWRLDFFAPTTSAQLASVISDETGSGSLVFGTSPTIATPTLTSPTLTSPSVTGGTITNATLVTPSVAVINGGSMAGSTLTLRSTTDATKATAGVLIDEAIVSTSTSTGALVVSSGLGVGGRLSAKEIYAESLTEKLTTTPSSLSGTIGVSYLDGTAHYHTGILGSFVPNFTNVPTTDNRTIVFVIMVQQGAGGAYAPTGVQIDGVVTTVNWANNTLPEGTPNNIDQFTFTLIRTSNAWKVISNAITYGAGA